MYIILYIKKHSEHLSIAISNELEFILYGDDGKLSCCNWMRKFKEVATIKEIYQTKATVHYDWFNDLISKVRKVDAYGTELYDIYRTEIVGLESSTSLFYDIKQDASLVPLSQRFEPGTIIKHFKRELVNNNGTEYLYLYIGQVRHTETDEDLALYSALYTDKSRGVKAGDLFARPSHLFFGIVDKEKYPNIKQFYRFEATALDIERGNDNE